MVSVTEIVSSSSLRWSTLNPTASSADWSQFLLKLFVGELDKSMCIVFTVFWTIDIDIIMIVLLAIFIRHDPEDEVKTVILLGDKDVRLCSL